MISDLKPVHGVIRAWNAEDGWGIIDAPETPGGCWAHFSALQVDGFRTAQAEQRVTFTFERAQQDGFSYRAVEVRFDPV